MSVNASSFNNLVEAANSYQDLKKSISRFVSYKGYVNKKENLFNKFKLLCINSEDIDKGTTITKAKELYGEKIASKMQKWCENDQIKIHIGFGGKEITFSEDFDWGVAEFNKTHQRILGLPFCKQYFKAREEYKDAVKKELENGQTVDNLKQELEKLGDFTDKTLGKIKQ